MKTPNLKKSAVVNVVNNASTQAGAGSRYRNLILSIAIFLSLIGALLAYTFYTSRVLQQNTGLVNVSNQVANDSQSVIKDLFDMQNSYGEDITSPHMTTVLGRLKENSESIEKNLSAMEKGGDATDTDGHTISLPTLSDPETLAALKDTRQQWEQLRPKVQDYLKVGGDIKSESEGPLAIAADQAKISSLSMNDSLGKLTASVFEKAQSQANNIRLIQILGVATILGYFAIFIFFFVRRLRKSDEQAQAAQKETDDIMKNVGTGLFLLDDKLTIGNQYSTQLASILGTDQIAGQNLTSLLKNKVSVKDLETTQSFVQQLYNPRVKEKLINDLNPLKKVMIQDEKNLGQSRFLDFDFSRVLVGNRIDRILVNVQDVTHQVRLEQRLEHERAQNDLQVEMLTTILNVNPSIIKEFIANTHQNIIKINNILKSPGSQQSELEEKLNAMYRIMHSLKGEASVLKLHSFITIAGNFEEKLKGLQNKGKLSGNDFLPLTIHLDELLNLSNTIDSLGQRINQGGNTQTNTVGNANGSSAFGAVSSGKNQMYQQFADSIALRQNKDVVLRASGFNEINLPSDIDATVKEIVIQLIRNSVVHGIETPEQRTFVGKPAQGIIKLNLIDLSESYKLTIEDDGKGIDYNAIRERAVEMGNDPADVVQWDKSRLNSLIFKSGFSTRIITDEDAGRGVGMDIIKERVNDIHGTLTLDTQQGQYTRFTIKIPKAPVL